MTTAKVPTLLLELGTRTCSDLLSENTPAIRAITVLRKLEQAGPRRLVGRFCMLKPGFETRLDKDSVYLVDEFIAHDTDKSLIGFVIIDLLDEDFLPKPNARWYIDPNNLEVW